MHARFKLVKAKADISNKNKSVKRFDKVSDDLRQIDLGAKRASLRAQLNIRFITLKLLSTVAVPTGKVFDMAITLNKLGYSSGWMFFPAAIRIFACSHSVLSKAESIWRQYQ
jgi:hypothetical protein